MGIARARDCGHFSLPRRFRKLFQYSDTGNKPVWHAPVWHTLRGFPAPPWRGLSPLFHLQLFCSARTLMCKSMNWEIGVTPNKVKNKLKKSGISPTTRPCTRRAIFTATGANCELPTDWRSVGVRAGDPWRCITHRWERVAMRLAVALYLLHQQTQGDRQIAGSGLPTSVSTKN
jgi:hypothetical protein